MAGFLYFLETSKAVVSLDDAKEAGLGYAFEAEPASCKVYDGPGGPGGQGGSGGFGGPGEGVVFADGTAVAVQQIGYWPDRQAWRKVPGTGAWVGWYTQQTPGPADLSRAQQVGGHEVVLCDGRRWLVPVARGFHDPGGGPSGYMALPSAAALDADGAWVPDGVTSKYKTLWDTAVRWWDVLCGAQVGDAGGGSGDSGADSGGAAVSMGFAEMMDAAVVALGANYRVGKAEVAALGLLDEQTAARVLQALVDWPTLLELLQKKTDAPDPPEVTGGVTGGGCVTGPGAEG